MTTRVTRCCRLHLASASVKCQFDKTEFRQNRLQLSAGHEKGTPGSCVPMAADYPRPVGSTFNGVSGGVAYLFLSFNSLNLLKVGPVERQKHDTGSLILYPTRPLVIPSGRDCGRDHCRRLYLAYQQHMWHCNETLRSVGHQMTTSGSCALMGDRP